MKQSSSSAMLRPLYSAGVVKLQIILPWAIHIEINLALHLIYKKAISATSNFIKLIKYFQSEMSHYLKKFLNLEFNFHIITTSQNETIC